MSSPSDQRRKRKRIVKPCDSPSIRQLFSVRSLLLCFTFVVFVYLVSRKIHFSSSSFHPILVVSSLSLQSFSSSSSAEKAHSFGGFLLPLNVEDRVLFPDHVLLLVNGGKKDWVVKMSGVGELECVYYGKTLSSTTEIVGDDRDVQKALSLDEYDEFRSIVRCPLPSVNYSAEVNLRWAGKKNGILRDEGIGLRFKNRTISSWENIVYAASLDGGSVVVFVKGLSLRPGRESDPSLYSCHFGAGKWERTGKYMLRTKALSAAQEVVRCSLPPSMKNMPYKVEGLPVTIGVARHFRGRAHIRALMPSVGKISVSKPEGRKRNQGKYELCVCTMVWNQASAIREWIMYHSWLGVERWFIYDNNSDDGIDEIIRELDLENYNVTRHVWPWIKTQEAGFSHCALRARDECKWVSFMDVDEYFYFPYSTSEQQGFRGFGYAGQNSLRELVSNFSSSSRTIAELRTSCHSFGPSGLISPPPQGVTVGYTCRLLNPERHKSIVRLDALDPSLLNVVHHFRLKKGFRYLNLPQTTAVINHYKYQVWEMFRAKFHRRVATYVADWQENQNEGSRDRAPGLGTEAIEPPDWRQKFCEVWDTGLRDFVLIHLADLSTGLLPWEMQFALSE